MPDLPPHFALPFSYGADGHPAEVEQDSTEDVVQGVQAVLLTQQGDRTEKPDFGRDELVPDEVPLGVAGIVSAVRAWEPRAEILATEDPDAILSGHARITVQATGGR